MRTPDKDRKASERARMRGQDFKLVQYWVHVDDYEDVRKYVEKKRRARLKSKLLNIP